jgi:predicted O-linked N-acetylglucosamine transferase (SPINDLY family)
VIFGAEDERHYAEKPILLPCFQPTDPGRPLAPPAPPRAALGLPEDGFVFCCFNGAYKITVEVFAAWMRILNRIPKSVLWLRGNNADMQANLRRMADTLGVDPARIVFAPQVSAAEHMARTRAADLFLDTTPYNAHTTASDALWAGLPVLTTYGKSYAARVTASLLQAVGLPLVAKSLEEYEDMAVALAGDAARLAGLKAQLADPTRLPLFDITTFARRLEEAFCRIAGRD